MTDLSNRIDKLTHELRALQLQLQWTAFESSSPGEQTRILNRVLKADLVSDLKSALDQLAEFLWCYIEAAAANSPSATDLSVQGRRLSEVAEMLRLLRCSSSMPEPSAFVSRVTSMVDRHMEEQETIKAGKRESLPPARLERSA